MKKRFCILLMLLMLFSLALAEETNPFAPYELTAPEGVVLEEGEGSLTFVQGNTRAVAQVIDRVPDEDPAEALLRMMAQFEPFAILGEDVPVAEGFVAVSAVNADKFGDSVDLHIVMVLSDDGALLILSAYDLEGDSDAALALLDGLLADLTADGIPILLPEE